MTLADGIKTGARVIFCWLVIRVYDKINSSGCEADRRKMNGGEK